MTHGSSLGDHHTTTWWWVLGDVDPTIAV